MKSLILLRHGKSDWDASYDNDHDRPLAKRGIRAARLIGQYLAKIQSIPDSVISSSATRATRTAELAMKAGKWSSQVRTTSDLYGTTPNDVVREIHLEPDSTKVLLLVGHQPTWSELASKLIGGGQIQMPTATAARFEFDALRWVDVDFGQGTLLWLVRPRDLEMTGLETEGDD